jgi:hypothetical protein
LQFVSKKELQKAGQIETSSEDHEWLTRNDTVMMKLKSAAKVGDKLQIFHRSREVRHPVTYMPLGSVVDLLGVATVERAQGLKVEARITEAWAPIVRGDKVAPYADWPSGVQPKPNARKMKGVVVEALEEYVTQLGEHTVVFLDKGKGDGLEPGNTFVVLRSHDAYTADKLPVDEEIGKLMVLDVKDGASTALITHSVTEIFAGDRIEMRPPEQQSAAN